MAKGEVEHMARRCSSCKKYYISPCGDDAGRLKSCPNWSHIQNAPRTPRVHARKPKAHPQNDHPGDIVERTQTVARVSEPRVQRTKRKGKRQ